MEGGFKSTTHDVTRGYEAGTSWSSGLWGSRSLSTTFLSALLKYSVQTNSHRVSPSALRRQLPDNFIEHDPLLTITITMSNDAIAFFRKTYGDQLGKLAEEHYNKDLEDTDRETLKVAAAKFRTHAAIGSVIGITLGAFLAFRVRSARTKMFNAFKAREKPVSVSFADGRTGLCIDSIKMTDC